jgi:hypothetical protein
LLIINLACNNNLEGVCSTQRKTRDVCPSRECCLKDVVGFSEELRSLESSHKNHQALLKTTKSHSNDDKQDQLPKDSITVVMEGSNISSEASERKHNSLKCLRIHYS